MVGFLQCVEIDDWVFILWFPVSVTCCEEPNHEQPCPTTFSLLVHWYDWLTYAQMDKGQSADFTWRFMPSRSPPHHAVSWWAPRYVSAGRLRRGPLSGSSYILVSLLEFCSLCRDAIPTALARAARRARGAVSKLGHRSGVWKWVVEAEVDKDEVLIRDCLGNEIILLFMLIGRRELIMPEIRSHDRRAAFGCDLYISLFNSNGRYLVKSSTVWSHA